MALGALPIRCPNSCCWCFAHLAVYGGFCRNPAVRRPTSSPSTVRARGDCTRAPKALNPASLFRPGDPPAPRPGQRRHCPSLPLERLALVARGSPSTPSEPSELTRMDETNRFHPTWSCSSRWDASHLSQPPWTPDGLLRVSPVSVRTSINFACRYGSQPPNKAWVRSRNRLTKASAPPPDARIEANSSRRSARSLMAPLR